MKSMTAFAQQSIEGDFGILSWELRGVNHRYLELNFRMPETLRGQETRCRQAIQKKTQRGKIEATLKWQQSVDAQLGHQVDVEKADLIMAQAKQLQAHHPELTPLSVAELMNWPGVVQSDDIDQQALESQMLALLDQALIQFIDTRSREGERLGSFITERCDSIATLVGQVKARRPAVLAGIREKITNKLTDLGTDYDGDRLEQELVLLSQKLDVDEELDRLNAHLAEMQTVLKRSDPIGRRLDFLMQEFNREANTLSSKAHDHETTQAAIDMKVLIEQMREQIQNIE